MNIHTTLYTTIQTVVSKFHLIVIPTDGKKPHASAGRTIRHFWTTPPSQAQIETWFNNQQITSYAILCGSISGNLFVLDFDDKREYRKFKQQFPRIAQSLTVKTRRGYHIYLRSDKAIKAQKIKGGDLQGEGTYIIGPGSNIDGRQYVIKSDQQIYKIRNNEFNDLMTEIGLPSRQPKPLTKTEIPQDTKYLVKTLQKLAPKHGRNNALYRVATRAKAQNIPIENIKRELIEAYVTEKPHWQHHPERENTRIREALRTIQSAYNTKKQSQRTNTGRLPTALREEMLKASANENKDRLKINSSTVHGRLLEALLTEGIGAHQTFTIKEAQEIGKKYKISTKGVYQVLRDKKGLTPTKRRLFRIVKQSPHVGDTDSRTINKDYESTNQTPNRGRTTQFRFEMPSIEELCDMYNIIPQSWDSLEPKDLMSAKAYKEAIHREYIRRCSPEQSVTYLANRLGCHPRTIYRYDANLNVKTIPIFGFIPLTWANVDDPNLYGEVRPDGITQGKWLQRPDGKRFPLVKGIALSQLSQDKILVACERRPSRRLLSQSAMSVFDVIWRRSDLPVGEWDVGGSPTVLPALGPEITSLITTNHDSVNVPEPKQPNPRQTRDNLTFVRSQQKHTLLHPMLNHSLTLVPGIGLSRQNKLYDLGISTLADLVNSDPHQLVSSHWYGGYVTLHTIRNWQEEAAILLGWRERDPASIEIQRQQCAIQTYRKYLKSVIKFVDHTFTLINNLAFIEDLPEIEPTRTYLKLKSLDNLSKQKNSTFYKETRMVELHELACNFFIFFREYINHMLSLQDWELEEYGFGSHAFWKRQTKRLDKMEAQFQPILLIEA